MVPLPVGAVQAGEHRVADQHVAGVALEGDGLAGAVVAVDDVTVGERKRVLAVLELIG